MELVNSFTVPAPIEEAWETLLNVERVAPCMPGAALDNFDGDAFAGTVRVKIGAIQMAYHGEGTFVERDAVSHRVVIDASGKEKRGGGTASATVTCVLTALDDATHVDVTTHLAITGKPAQFGRGAIQDISGKIVDQFAANLAIHMATASPNPETSSDEVDDPHAVRPRSQLTDPIDLLSLAVPALKIRLVGAALAATAALLAIHQSRRRRTRSKIARRRCIAHATCDPLT